MKIKNISISINYDGTLDYSAIVDVDLESGKTTRMSYAKDDLELSDGDEKSLVTLVETIKTCALDKAESDLTVQLTDDERGVLVKSAI